MSKDENFANVANLAPKRLTNLHVIHITEKQKNATSYVKHDQDL